MINIFAVQMEENFETDVVDRIGLVDHMKRVKLGSGDKTKKKSLRHIDGGLFPLLSWFLIWGIAILLFVIL